MGFFIKVGLAAPAGFVLVSAIVGSKQSGTPATATTPASPPVAKAPQMKADVQVLHFGCTYSYGFAIVEGEICNISDAPISNLMVVATYYSSDEKLVRSDTAMVEYNPIMPGQKSPFKAMSTYNPMMRTCTVGFKRMFGGTVRVQQ